MKDITRYKRFEIIKLTDQTYGDYFMGTYRGTVFYSNTTLNPTKQDLKKAKKYIKNRIDEFWVYCFREDKAEFLPDIQAPKNFTNFVSNLEDKYFNKDLIEAINKQKSDELKADFDTILQHIDDIDVRNALAEGLNKKYNFYLRYEEDKSCEDDEDEYDDWNWGDEDDEV